MAHLQDDKDPAHLENAVNALAAMNMAAGVGQRTPHGKTQNSIGNALFGSGVGAEIGLQGSGLLGLRFKHRQAAAALLGIAGAGAGVYLGRQQDKPAQDVTASIDTK